MRKILKQIRYPNIYLSRKEYILIISHMRCFTTLIGHILASNQEISGYTEKHISYESLVDFMELRRKVHNEHDGESSGRYLLDKVLHDKHKISGKVLGRNNVTALYMVRRPEESLKSINHMGTELSSKDWGGDYDRILGYYTRRLESISNYSKLQSGKRIFIKAENIVDNPDQALCKLGKCLGLHRPLSSRYSRFKFTGKAGQGDRSDHINQGQIRKDRNEYKDIEIPGQILEQAQKSYDLCVSKLKTNCENVI